MLRRPLGLTLTAEELALEASDYHVACYVQGKLVGCLVLTPLPNGEMKMRQVAVPEAQQGKRIGTAMVETLLAEMRQRGAPQGAFVGLFTAKYGFYEKLGFKKDLGMHLAL